MVSSHILFSCMNDSADLTPAPNPPAPPVEGGQEALRETFSPALNLEPVSAPELGEEVANTSNSAPDTTHYESASTQPHGSESQPKIAPLADGNTSSTEGTMSTQRRHVSWSLFVLVQCLLLMFVLGGFLWLDRKLERPTASTLETGSQTNPPLSAHPGDEVTALQTSLSRAQDQITTLQRQIDAQRTEREGTQAKLQEMADRMALVIKQTSFVPTGDTQNLSTGDAAQVAAMLPSVSPATSELILLKERNRLTDYGDKAIATGARESLQAIVDSMFDPALKHLRHASEAEFRRVQAYFEISSSIDPTFKLPLQELFKDGSVRAEADLTPAQLTQLLHDVKQPWEVRLRCAYLLRASADPGTNATLLKAIKDDPSLDVVKQAQTTFEKRVGQRFRLFDIPSIEAWWAAQKAK